MFLCGRPVLDATPSPLPASSSACQPATQQVLSSSAMPPVPPSYSSDAERRQLTVVVRKIIATLSSPQVT